MNAPSSSAGEPTVRPGILVPYVPCDDAWCKAPHFWTAVDGVRLYCDRFDASDSEKAVDSSANMDAIVVAADEGAGHLVHGEKAVSVELRGVQEPLAEIKGAREQHPQKKHDEGLPADPQGAHGVIIG